MVQCRGIQTHILATAGFLNPAERMSEQQILRQNGELRLWRNIRWRMKRRINDRRNLNCRKDLRWELNRRNDLRQICRSDLRNYRREWSRCRSRDCG